MVWGLATTKKSKKILALFPMKSCIFNVFSSMKSYVFNVVNSRWLVQDTAYFQKHQLWDEILIVVGFNNSIPDTLVTTSFKIS